MSTEKSLEKLKNILNSASSLAVQWLGLCAFTAVSQFQSLVGELRSHKLQRVVKKIWGGELNRNENTAYMQCGGSSESSA